MRDGYQGFYEFLKELKTTEEATDSFVKLLNDGRELRGIVSSVETIYFISNFVKRDQTQTNLILDPACGSGCLLAYIGMITESSKTIGFDINNTIIEKASTLFPELDLEVKSTTKDFLLDEKVDLIVSELPWRARLRNRIFKGEKHPITMIGDAIIFYSTQHLSDDGTAIFLVGPSFLNRRDSLSLIARLEDDGVYLNAVIGVERPRPDTKSNGSLLIFSKRENENIFFSGCTLLEGEDTSNAFYSPGKLDSDNNRWAPLEKFIGFGENNIPLINDASVHKENLKKSLRSSSSLYNYQTLEDVMIESKYIKEGEQIDDFNNLNALYIRRNFPISTTDTKELKSWKGGYFVIILDASKVKSQYLEYLLGRTVGKYMIDTISSGNVIKFVKGENLASMPIFLPSIDVQSTVLTIRNLIDEKTLELENLKMKLNDLDDLESIKNEIQEMHGGEITIEQLLYREESSVLEFKSSLWREFDGLTPADRDKDEEHKQKNKFKNLEDSVIKTLCAFLNSEGGTLLIGVSDIKGDDGKSEITGIEHDYKFCKENNRNSDGFGQAIENIIRDKLRSRTTAIAKHITKSFHEVDGSTICKIDVRPAPRKGHGYAVFAKLSKEKEGILFIRSGETTAPQSRESQTNYIASHFMGIDEE